MLDFAAEESVHAAHNMTATPPVIALARPLRRALGGGSAGIGPAHHHGGSHVQILIPDAKLKDTQLVILSAAAQRADGSLLPLPQSLSVKGAALGKVVDTLCKRKLVDERKVINGAPEWRRDEERRPLGLFITNAGLLALGVDDTEKTKPAQAAASMPRQRKTGAAKPAPQR